MKKIFIVASVLVLILMSCDTDFDVNAQWEETTVMYGLLDAGVDTQYIKINKAFLGEGDAIMMAQYSDSLNFNPNNLEVKLHKLTFLPFLGSYDTLMSIILDTTLLEKEDGLFAVDNNIIYRAVVPSGFLRDDYMYGISVHNLISGNKVSSLTEVISNFTFSDFNSSYKIGFYNPAQPDTLKFKSKTMRWGDVKNGKIYQLAVRFNYLEEGILKSLLWNQEQVEESGASVMQVQLEGAKFFNYLSLNLSGSNLVRQFVNLDLVMTVGTENLATYIKVNEPLTGISQQRPEFTNIYNGIGIFSSRYTHTEFDIDLTDDTRNFLIEELDRGFQ